MQNSNEPQSGIISLRVILLSIFLAVLLAASSTYLALKIGILPTASIPAAILAMAILRFLKKTNIYEINLIQTAASAGEAVAGGIVFTIPALVIMHYWKHFPYLENVAIALTGGLLGILFSIPLRRILVNAPQLYFPEAKAIAEVLFLVKKEVLHYREIIMGISIGSLLELAQTSFKVFASSAEKYFVLGKTTIVGFGIGFSPALVGVGYLIGFDVGISLILGALIAWVVVLPSLSIFAAIKPFNLVASLAVYRNDIHYIGLGAMLMAGLWTLINLLKPFYQSFRISTLGLFNASTNSPLILKKQDIPTTYLLFALPVLMVSIYFLFQYLFPIHIFSHSASLFINLGAVIYVVVLGFIFAAICGYFSGLVGVTASPGSAILTGALLITATILRALFIFQEHFAGTGHWLNMAAMTIIIGAVLGGTAAIANDTTQDLKVGQLIGATPWQQQLMLILGVIVAALVIPYVMELLFNVYGLTTVIPHVGMDPGQTLPAPPAAMMAGLTQGIFNHDLPWPMLGIGALIIIVFIVLQLLGLKKLSLLGIAMGIYLPLSSSVPLFLGSLFAFFIRKNFQKKLLDASEEEKVMIDQHQHYAVLLACGLVAGSALMSVILAILISLSGNPDMLAIMPTKWNNFAIGLSFLSLVGLGFGFYRVSYTKK